MAAHHVEKERFAFDYACHKIDCVFAILRNTYELVVAVHTANFGFVVNIYKNSAGSYIAEIDDVVYVGFCKALGLNYSKDHFTSNALLTLLSKNTPVKSNGVGVPYQDLRQFVKYRAVDEASKNIFCGWNDHVKDKKTARNFDKTEFYLGKTVADYCREHNISSLWTDIPHDEVKVTFPYVHH